MVVKTDPAQRTGPNGEDRRGEAIAESRLEGLRSREGSDSERVRPGGRKVWTLERILGVLSENSGYEILRFWQKFLMSYLGLDFVRGCALPRACLTRTALPSRGERSLRLVVVCRSR